MTPSSLLQDTTEIKQLTGGGGSWNQKTCFLAVLRISGQSALQVMITDTEE